MELSELKPSKNNPRKIKDERFLALVKSIREFPEMLKLRPIIYEKEKNIIGGNMRYRALIEAGYTTIPDEYTKSAEELTEEQLKRFLIIDNVNMGEFESEKLEGWDPIELAEWGLDPWEIALGRKQSPENIPDFEELIENTNKENTSGDTGLIIKIRCTKEEYEKIMAVYKTAENIKAKLMEGKHAEG